MAQRSTVLPATRAWVQDLSCLQVPCCTLRWQQPCRLAGPLEPQVLPTIGAPPPAVPPLPGAPRSRGD